MGYQALLFCPDGKTARTVSQVLSELDFSVEPCTEPFSAVKKLMAQRFDAVVVDCNNEQNAMLLFKSARNSGANQTALAVAVVEGQAGVAKAFRIGANLVLTKPINVEQAKGTLRVARGLLRKGSEAARSTPPPGPGPGGASVRPTSGTPPRASAPALPSVPTAAPLAKPAKAPSAAVLETSAIGAGETDPDALLEPRASAFSRSQQSAPLRPAPLATTAGGGTKPSYPWQRAFKPTTEPMGSQLPQAAETTNQEQTRPPAKAKPATPPSLGTRPATASFGSATAAAARAPAKETVRPGVSALDPEPQAASPKPLASVKPSAVEAPTTKTIAHPDVQPPSFSMGSEVDEEGEGGKKRAIAIVAAVLILAASAAYLGWRNSSRHGAPPPALQAAPGGTAADRPSDPRSDDSQPASRTDSIDASGNARTAPAPATIPKTSPAIRGPAKESSVPAASESAEPEPAPEPLVVKRDTPRATAPAAAPQNAEPVQPPSSIGGAPDAKELASISNVAVGVPKPVPQLVKISQGVSEGLLLKKVPPKYPSQAIQMRVQGAVEMQATISKEGDITNLNVLTGDSILARAAQDAVKQWKYKPYYLNGEPVEIQTTITVNFKLPN